MVALYRIQDVHMKPFELNWAQSHSPQLGLSKGFLSGPQRCC